MTWRITCLAAVLTAAPAMAQAPAPDAPPVIFRSDSRLVDLHVSVLDKAGNMIKDIPESAFKVYENGVEQPIKVFRNEDAPVSMGILIDNSGSMRDKRAKVAAAALALVKASNPLDEVFIMNFNDKAYLDQPFTHDLKEMEKALDRINSRGNTAMRDAISLALDYLETGREDKKVLLVVTDGDDNASNETMEQMERDVRRSGVLIYTIGLLTEEEPRQARNARQALKALADASGGQDFYPQSVAEVEDITPRVAHEIRNQYTLAYSPLNQALDGSFRQIKVTVAGFGDSTVRTRNGYYATAAPTRAAGSGSSR